jgi:hypothetical protein
MQLVHRAVRDVWSNRGQVTVQLVLDGLTEEEAFSAEMFLIAEWGRRTLVNRTSGGPLDWLEWLESPTHALERSKPRSKQIKAKMSESAKRRWARSGTKSTATFREHALLRKRISGWREEGRVDSIIKKFRGED